MLVSIVITCLALFLFQRIIWLVVPGLFALMNYYCLRPLAQRLVFHGVRHDTAVAIIVGVLLVITVGIVFKSAPPLMAKVANLQGPIDHYMDGGQNLVRGTIRDLEEVAPVLKRASLSRIHAVELQF